MLANTKEACFLQIESHISKGMWYWWHGPLSGSVFELIKYKSLVEAYLVKFAAVKKFVHLIWCQTGLRLLTQRCHSHLCIFWWVGSLSCNLLGFLITQSDSLFLVETLYYFSQGAKLVLLYLQAQPLAFLTGLVFPWHMDDYLWDMALLYASLFFCPCFGHGLFRHMDDHLRAMAQADPSQFYSSLSFHLVVV